MRSYRKLSLTFDKIYKVVTSTRQDRYSRPGHMRNVIYFCTDGFKLEIIIGGGVNCGKSPLFDSPTTAVYIEPNTERDDPSF